MATATEQLQGSYVLDHVHSSASFAVKHMVVSTFRGRFEKFDATLTDGKLVGTVDVGSIVVKDENLAAHLQSPEFFDAERHPELRFESTQISPVDDETFEIAGDLTMNGVTKPITLTAEVQGEETDPWGNERVALEVTGQLNRGDWNMTFNQALGSGNLLVGEKVKLQLDIAAVKKG